MDRIKALRVALVAIGAIFLGVGILLVAWPSGWRWEPHQVYYEEMIVGVYAVLGVFLILAARDPLANRSLIWFTAISSAVHGAIMAEQSFGMTNGMNHMGHLMGDVPALFGVTIILGGLLWGAGRKIA